MAGDWPASPPELIGLDCIKDKWTVAEEGRHWICNWSPEERVPPLLGFKMAAHKTCTNQGVSPLTSTHQAPPANEHNILRPKFSLCSSGQHCVTLLYCLFSDGVCTRQLCSYATHLKSVQRRVIFSDNNMDIIGFSDCKHLKESAEILPQ